MIDQIIREDIERIKLDLRREVLEGRKVLVTGGAGFIGSWLCDVLFDLGAEVVCLDNLSTGKMENVDHLVGESSFRLTNEDVCVFKYENDLDYILHLASRASPEDYQRHPIETLQANSLGSYNMLELARKNNATILFASTSEAYGNAEVVPTPETYWGNVNPVGPRSCYFEGKRFAESLFMAYHKQYGLNVKIARIFNSYGPRLRECELYGRVVSRFIIQALANQPMTVYGDGKQTRSFCYVTDMVSSLALLTVSQEACGKVVNIGNPQEITILEFAQKIKELSRSKSTLTFLPLPKDDPRRRCPDISLAKRLLKLEPKISLGEGLARTIAWFRKKRT